MDRDKYIEDFFKDFISDVLDKKITQKIVEQEKLFNQNVDKAIKREVDLLARESFSNIENYPLDKLEEELFKKIDVKYEKRFKDYKDQIETYKKKYDKLFDEYMDLNTKLLLKVVDNKVENVFIENEKEDNK